MAAKSDQTVTGKGELRWEKRGNYDKGIKVLWQASSY
jgi:hypothetical protein